MKVKPIVKLLKNKKYIDVALKANEDIKVRYNELTQKGYSSDDIYKIILTELGLATVIAEGVKSVSVDECIAVGARIGASLGTPEAPGIGTFVGAGIGGFTAGKVCENFIEFGTKKAVQKLSEHMVDSPQNKNINISYLSSYIKDTKSDDISDFSVSKAVINSKGQNNTLILKGGISNLTKDIEWQKGDTLYGAKFLNNKSSVLDEVNDSGKITGLAANIKSYEKELSLRDRLLLSREEKLARYMQRLAEDPKKVQEREEKHVTLEELKSPQEAKKQKVRDIVEGKVEFDEKRDIASYKNKKLGSNKIFTQEEIDSMPEEEKHKNKSAIFYQKQTIGIPTEEQAKKTVTKGGMVFVNGYTRSDGTEVKSYYRSR